MQIKQFFLEVESLTLKEQNFKLEADQPTYSKSSVELLYQKTSFLVMYPLFKFHSVVLRRCSYGLLKQVLMFLNIEDSGFIG